MAGWTSSMDPKRRRAGEYAETPKTGISLKLRASSLVGEKLCLLDYVAEFLVLGTKGIVSISCCHQHTCNVGVNRKPAVIFWWALPTMPLDASSRGNTRDGCIKGTPGSISLCTRL